MFDTQMSNSIKNYKSVPVEAIHHFELPPEVLLGEMVEHSRIHQTFHERGAILR